MFTIEEKHALTKELLDVLNNRMNEWRDRIDDTPAQNDMLGEALMDVLANTLANVFLSVTPQPAEACERFCVTMTHWFANYVIQDHERRSNAH
jgi:hypothetical protein